MSYKAIIEIGPIFEFVDASRKTRDLWGASFLFSYLMGICAKSIVEKENGGKNISEILLRPHLENDELFRHIQYDPFSFRQFNDIEAGTIPDRLYCEIENLENLKKARAEMINALKKLYEESKNNIIAWYGKYSSQNNNIYVEDLPNAPIDEQLEEYFRLFWVVKENAQDFESLEKAAFTRSGLFEFPSMNDNANQVNHKYERCQLCGDRKAVLIIKNIRPGKNHQDEPLCALCTLKRGLRSVFKQQAAFPSTTDIAAQFSQQAIIKCFDNIKKELYEFFRKQIDDQKLCQVLIDEISIQKFNELTSYLNSISQHDKMNYSKVNDKIAYQNFYVAFPEANKLRMEVSNILKNELKDPNKNENEKKSIREKLIWLDRAFYCIVAMDADNMGTILKEAQKTNSNLARDLSKTLSDFAQNIASIINSHDGTLIYAGGEDLLFFVHPAKLLPLIRDIAKNFQQRFSSFQQKVNDLIGKETPLTLSGGAFICYHKHPLKLAKQGARNMEMQAKSKPGKNMLGISLHKGGGERANVFFPILKLNGKPLFNIENFIQIYELIMKGQLDISRSLVFKLMEEYEKMHIVLKDGQDLLGYCQFIVGKSRQQAKKDINNLKDMILNSWHCEGDNIVYEELIYRLYFLRFLTAGD